MLKRFVAVAFAAALVFGGAACSDDDGGGGGGSTQAQLADLLKEQAQAEDGVELSDDEADCLAGAMIDLIGEDEAQAALDSGDEPDFDALMGDDPEAALDFLDKMMECAPDLMSDAMSGGMEDGSSEGE